MNNQNISFSIEERETLYNIIFNRRDVRAEFTSQPIEDEILARLLVAAHHAPSVGFMQPWNFLLIDEKETQKKVHKLFDEANKEASEMFEGQRKNLYQNLKLEGLLKAPLHVCITCDRERAGPVVLGRTHMSNMDLYSTVCAVQNFWLAARAENIGVGWVSIFHEDELKQLLGIPETLHIIAYLTVGHVSSFNKKPDLERKGWRKRLNLKELIKHNNWQESTNDNLTSLIDKELKKQNPDERN